MNNLWILGLTGILLAGCYPGQTRDSNYLLSKGWATPREQENRDEHLYCYHTLGKNDCYSVPLERREDSRDGDHVRDTAVPTNAQGKFDRHNPTSHP